MNPSKMNYRMPGEWAKRGGTFMAWPVQSALCWPDNYQEVSRGYAQVAKAIAQFEPVTMLVNEADEKIAQELCGPTVRTLILEHNDGWLRDNGPTFLLNDQGDLAGVNWQFNAWGGKYEPWDLDDQVAPKLLKHLGVPCFAAPFVLEGGSIHVDGEGTLLTTEECLLNEKRNPHLSKEQLEDHLKEYLNVDKIIWLKKGLDGDETDGHIDNVACFAKPGAIILQTCSDHMDANYGIIQENLAILKNTTDAKGRKLDIIEIPQPPRIDYQDKRLTLSYLNFYLTEGGIVLPVFGGVCSNADEETEKILANTFPERRIVKVDGMALIKEGGNVHCITQQMPKGRKEDE